MEINFRYLPVDDWVALLFVIAMLLLVVANNNSSYKFSNFCKLLFTNTYIKTYKGDNLFKLFHLSIISFAVLFFPLILQKTLYYLGVLDFFLFVDYIKIVAFFGLFLLIKTMGQLILGKLIRNPIKMGQYVFEKQTYFAYLVFLSIVPMLFLMYSSLKIELMIYSFAFLWVTLFVLAMLLVIIHFKELFFNYLLYFILYLCAFEIAPIIGVILYIKGL